MQPPGQAERAAQRPRRRSAGPEPGRQQAGAEVAARRQRVRDARPAARTAPPAAPAPTTGRRRTARMRGRPAERGEPAQPGAPLPAASPTSAQHEGRAEDGDRRSPGRRRPLSVSWAASPPTAAKTTPDQRARPARTPASRRRAGRSRPARAAVSRPSSRSAAYVTSSAAVSPACRPTTVRAEQFPPAGLLLGAGVPDDGEQAGQRRRSRSRKPPRWAVSAPTLLAVHRAEQRDDRRVAWRCRRRTRPARRRSGRARSSWPRTTSAARRAAAPRAAAGPGPGAGSAGPACRCRSSALMRTPSVARGRSRVGVVL